MSLVANLEFYAGSLLLALALALYIMFLIFFAIDRPSQNFLTTSVLFSKNKASCRVYSQSSSEVLTLVEWSSDVDSSSDTVQTHKFPFLYLVWDFMSGFEMH